MENETAVAASAESYDVRIRRSRNKNSFRKVSNVRHSWRQRKVCRRRRQLTFFISIQREKRFNFVENALMWSCQRSLTANLNFIIFYPTVTVSPCWPNLHLSVLPSFKLNLFKSSEIFIRFCDCFLSLLSQFSRHLAAYCAALPVGESRGGGNKTQLGRPGAAAAARQLTSARKRTRSVSLSLSLSRAAKLRFCVKLSWSGEYKAANFSVTTTSPLKGTEIKLENLVEKKQVFSEFLWTKNLKKIKLKVRA